MRGGPRIPLVIGCSFVDGKEIVAFRAERNGDKFFPLLPPKDNDGKERGEGGFSTQLLTAHSTSLILLPRPSAQPSGAGAVEFIICHAEVSIAFVDEKKIQEVELKKLQDELNENQKLMLKQMIKMAEVMKRMEEELKNIKVENQKLLEQIHIKEDVHDKPTVRVYTAAHTSYSLAIRDNQVILALLNPRNATQHWYKDEKYCTTVRDEERHPSFVLVNKAIQHSAGEWQPVRLVTYNPDVLDESILWTQRQSYSFLGDGYTCIRMVNNIRLHGCMELESRTWSTHDDFIVFSSAYTIKEAQQHWKISLWPQI